MRAHDPVVAVGISSCSYVRESVSPLSLAKPCRPCVPNCGRWVRGGRRRRPLHLDTTGRESIRQIAREEIASCRQTVMVSGRSLGGEMGRILKLPSGQRRIDESWETNP